jgi:hypothetical protein
MKTLTDLFWFALFLAFCYTAPSFATKPKNAVYTVLLCKQEYGFCIDKVLYDQHMQELEVGATYRSSCSFKVLKNCEVRSE